MSEAENDEYQPVLIQLEGEVTVATITSLHEKFASEIDDGTNVQVEATKVTQVDTAGVQLLLSLRKWADAKGVKVKLLFPSEVLLQALSKLGYKRDLTPLVAKS